MSITDTAKYALKAVSNIHRQGALPNIFLFATARGGSTWVMEILASQPGMKYYDEPFNIRRDNVARVGLFRTWDEMMPGVDDPDLAIRYLNDLAAGAYPGMNPPPFRPYHRLMTDRIVFKIHVMEHLIGRIARECNGQVVFLMRHPIPTTLSRTMLPRLELFLTNPFFDAVIGDPARLAEIRRIGRGGTKLQQGVVSWCYQNVLALRQPDFDGLFVTYEELVLNPDRSCDLFIERLHFRDRERMRMAFGRAAANISMSAAKTASVISEADQRTRNEYLVSRWQEKVTAQDRADTNEVMALFGLDVYSGDQVLAHPRYLHFADTVHLIGQPATAGALP
ncbi:MAG: hypothetical protein R2712_22740 [Vicinamibacterales bacterium]